MVSNDLQIERSELISQRNMILAAEQAKHDQETAAQRQIEAIDNQLAIIAAKEQADRRAAIGVNIHAAAETNRAAIEDLYHELNTIVAAIGRIQTLQAVDTSREHQSAFIGQLINSQNQPVTGDFNGDMLRARQMAAGTLNTITPALSSQLALRAWVEQLPPEKQAVRAGIALALTGVLIRHNPSFDVSHAAREELKAEFSTTL